ncbi:MAG TPA: SRPBCC domain-containing protein [Candidatus Dormibacteraeota bacterium]|nr:SRPBCC domain-containing protein [Candidatus Dormibacteraeota bacterium]
MNDVTDRMGTLTETAGGWRLQFVRHLDRPPAVAWRAFTDPELVRRWFPTTIEGELVAGAPLRFQVTAIPMEPFGGSVVEIDEPHLFVLRWGEDVLRFELTAAGDGTDLSLSVQLGELGRAARDGAGWHECLDNLARDLGTDPEAAGGETWASIHPRYVECFGPEAATVGPPQELVDDRQTG